MQKDLQIITDIVEKWKLLEHQTPNLQVAIGAASTLLDNANSHVLKLQEMAETAKDYAEQFKAVHPELLANTQSLAKAAAEAIAAPEPSTPIASAEAPSPDAVAAAGGENENAK